MSTLRVHELLDTALTLSETLLYALRTTVDAAKARPDEIKMLRERLFVDQIKYLHRVESELNETVNMLILRYLDVVMSNNSAPAEGEKPE